MIPREQWDRERFPDGTFRVRCSICGKSVSSPLAEPVIIRAWVECPECLDTVGSAAALGEAHAALEALADDYEALLGDGLTRDTEPGVLRDAREVLGARGKAL